MKIAEQNVSPGFRPLFWMNLRPLYFSIGRTPKSTEKKTLKVLGIVPYYAIQIQPVQTLYDPTFHTVRSPNMLLYVQSDV